MRTLSPLWSAMLLATVCSQAYAMNLTEAIQSTLDEPSRDSCRVQQPPGIG
jgi:hypothetical protein